MVLRSVFLSLVFFLSVSQAAMVDKIVAIVNADVILDSDVRRFEKTLILRKELDPLFGFNEDIRKNGVSRQNIIHFLIQERLIAQQFKVTDPEVDQEIQTVQKNNNLSKDDLNGFLKSKGFSYDEYRELMRVGIQKRNLLNSEIRTRVNISDDDVRNYYYNQAMKNQSIPLEYNIQMITVSFKSFTSQASALKAAQEALKSIQQGEAFADVAKSASDDPSSQSGGNLGYLSGEHLVEPLKSAVAKLQIGNVSDLIKGPSGYYIVKLLEVRSSESQKFIEAKEQIREQLAKDEYKKQIENYSERLWNDAYVHTN